MANPVSRPKNARPQPTKVGKPNRHSRYQATGTDLPATGYIRLPKVLTVIPVSPSGWWAGIQAGRFPKGVKLSPRVTAWDVCAIRALIVSLNPSQGVGDE